MSKKHESYKIYKAILHLYPKYHREAYGQQMVQTLDDLLLDQQDSYGRFIVWLRVTFELPINIIEENIRSRGEISVSKLTKITNKQHIYLVFAILVIGSYVAMGIIWRHDRGEINSLKNEVITSIENQYATNGGSYNAVTIEPSDNSVYLPLARLKLPATTLNEGLVYSYEPTRTIPGAEVDISTHDLSVHNYSSTQQFDCSEVAYADFASPSYPINPMYKSDGSVKLADGRTMNVYYASSIPGCKGSWQVNNINSKAIADSLKQASSY